MVGLRESRDVVGLRSTGERRSRERIGMYAVCDVGGLRLHRDDFRNDSSRFEDRLHIRIMQLRQRSEDLSYPGLDRIQSVVLHAGREI